MSLSEQLVGPSADRANALDAGLRGRLSGSIDYLAGLLRPEPLFEPHWQSLRQQLENGPVSPWVFGLYANLVADLSNDADVSAYPRNLAAAAAMPARTEPLPFGDVGVPAAWWQYFTTLFDTDRDRPFRTEGPAGSAGETCASDVAEALKVLAEVDPPFFADVSSTIRTIVLASPAAAVGSPVFNGASTFFLWGLSLLNADLRRDAISMIDLLVHESGHLLLFAIAGGSALTTNDPSARYASPLRPDPRPIEGVFHAAFVASRVHCAMTRLLDSARLEPDMATIAVRRREHNATAAKAGLETLAEHALPTERGGEVLSGLRRYWSVEP